MKKIFLTGSTGYIGKAIIEKFGPAAEIRAFTRDKGDIRNKADVIEASAGCDVIIHMAAITPSAHPGADDKDVLEVNIEGTRNVLEAAVTNGIKKVVYFSSVCAVGFRESNYPIKEDEVCRPTQGAYGLSKLKGEELCREYSDKQGLSVICLRPATVIPQHGFTPPEAGTMPWIGFVHIDDVLLILKLALDNENIKFGVYHVAPDNRFSKFDIALAKKALNYRPSYNFREFTKVDYFKLFKRKIKELIKGKR